MNVLFPFAVHVLVLGAGAAAQDPLVPRTPPPPIERSDEWTEGFGRATTYREALAQALEDAVGRAKGIAVARGAGVRSRLLVIADPATKLPEGFFDGEAEKEKEWVQHQIQGFVKKYEIQKKEQAADGNWEITVRAQVAGPGAAEQKVVVELVDNDLTAWRLERFEEDGAGEPFDRSLGGKYEGVRLAENLRASGLVEVAAQGQGVSLGDGVAPEQREKLGQRLVASHRVTVAWQPMAFKSLVERPNVARPSSGPRPQYLTSGAVQLSVKIVDLVRGVEVYERPMTIALDFAPSTPVDRLDAFVVQLADKAKAAIAETIVFTLRPPVVTRKWAGDDGEWMVEASMPRRIAQGYRDFVVGNNGSLASPDWRPLARATLVGGDDTKCTFKLVNAEDPSAIEEKITEVRPAKE